MSKRLDHVTAAKVSAALAARAAFGDSFGYHSAELAGLQFPLVEQVFNRPVWQTRERPTSSRTKDHDNH